MKRLPAEPQPWSRRRWGGIVVLILVVQVSLIVWLGARTPIRPRPPAAVLTLHLAEPASAELRALYDPTLFTLPHAQGFSGSGWQSSPRLDSPLFEWMAPTNRPSLAVDQLGAVLPRLLETNHFGTLQLPVRREADPTLPDLPPLAVLENESVLRLEGGLTRRRLLTPLQLKPWPNPDILTNTVIQVVVDAEGWPTTWTLLSGSGSTDADQDALNQVKTARFEPLSHTPADTGPDPAARLTWGEMIFRWHTVPAPLASIPAPGP